MINADLIETIEACPDTTITLMTKRKFVVSDTLDDVIRKVVDYRRRINAHLMEDAVVTPLPTSRDASPAPTIVVDPAPEIRDEAA